MYPVEDYSIPQDRVVTLRGGFIWIVLKKPSRAIIGVYQSEDQAEALIARLGGKKYFRKQRFTLDTNLYHDPPID